MTSLWFVMPAHGRLQMAEICMRQLRRTCDELTASGIEATAVVVACDENLDLAKGLGFGTVERPNQYVSQRFNDGIQLALDPSVNPRPADFVMPIGSDDWIDWRIINARTLPAPNEVVGFQHISFVREDGQELTKTFLNYTGGCGMRLYPRQLLEPLNYRPAEEDLRRGCDTSILTNVRAASDDVHVMHVATDPLQIVDWKTPAQNLNNYRQVAARHFRNSSPGDPWEELGDVYPADALEEMRRLYDLELVAA